MENLKIAEIKHRIRKKTLYVPMKNIFFVIRPRRIFVISVFSTTRAAPKQMGGGE